MNVHYRSANDQNSLLKNPFEIELRPCQHLNCLSSKISAWSWLACQKPDKSDSVSWGVVRDVLSVNLGPKKFQ